MFLGQGSVSQISAAPDSDLMTLSPSKTRMAAEGENWEQCSTLASTALQVIIPKVWVKAHHVPQCTIWQSRIALPDSKRGFLDYSLPLFVFQFICKLNINSVQRLHVWERFWDKCSGLSDNLSKMFNELRVRESLQSQLLA